MNILQHLQTRIFDTPLAIKQSKMEVILSAIGDRIGLDITPEMLAAAKNSQAAEQKTYSMTSDGIAIVPIQGTLLKKSGMINALSGCSSYEEIAKQMQLAIDSPSVRGILLDVNSPGGETNSLFDLADSIYSMRGKKPIYASVNDSAYSAAYAIASAADKIYITRTGGCGSIGVFCMHVDQSGADKQAGMKYTYIKAGEKKAEGNPHEKLSDSALADTQAEVDREYAMFVRLVAQNRSTSVNKIAATEAGCYFAENAIPLLADKVGTLQDALADLSSSINADRSIINMLGQTNMNKDILETVGETNELPIVAVADPEAKKAVDPEIEPDPDEEEEDDKEAKAKCDPEEEKMKKAVVEDPSIAASITRIVNLCTLSGHADLAASYINKHFSVAQVEQELLEQRSAKSNSTKVNNMIDNTTVNPSSAFDRLEVGAQALAKEKGISKAKAYQELCLANPQMYDDYLDERDMAAVSGKAREYVAAVEQKIAKRGN